jgi:hypothetical protein
VHHDREDNPSSRVRLSPSVLEQLTRLDQHNRRFLRGDAYERRTTWVAGDAVAAPS